MYYPYLRGRQNELLCLQELLESQKLDKKIIPILEPVRFNSTYINTLKKFAEYEREIIVIKNPKVGRFFTEYQEALKASQNDRTKKILNEYEKILENEYISSAYITDDQTINMVLSVSDETRHSLYLINKGKGDSKYYEEYADELDVKASFIPNDMDFKDEVEGNCIVLEGEYQKAKRNVDYLEHPDDFFSRNHLTYLKLGYQGFGDYSIVGDEYEESGFAPLAIAIHIVYFDEKNKLNIHHFVSDSNDNYYDLARKFEEAMEKLMLWEKLSGIKMTKGLKGLIDYYENGKFPGLGVIKKCSIMHHLELMGEFLEGHK